MHTAHVNSTRNVTARVAPFAAHIDILSVCQAWIGRCVRGSMADPHLGFDLQVQMLSLSLDVRLHILLCWLRCFVI